MVGALIEFTKEGRVKAVYMIGQTDNEVAVAEYGVMRLVRPSTWGWRCKSALAMDVSEEILFGIETGGLNDGKHIPSEDGRKAGLQSGAEEESSTQTSSVRQGISR